MSNGIQLRILRRVVVPSTSHSHRRDVRSWRFFPLLNQQSEYKVIYELMCWLSGSLTCRVPNVMRSPPARISLVSSVTVDWCLAPHRWGFYLESKPTNYPDHGHHEDPPPHKENPHGSAANRTRDLAISSQKLRPLDHEADRVVKMKTRSSFERPVGICHSETRYTWTFMQHLISRFTLPLKTFISAAFMLKYVFNHLLHWLF